MLWLSRGVGLATTALVAPLSLDYGTVLIEVADWQPSLFFIPNVNIKLNTRVSKHFINN